MRFVLYMEVLGGRKLKKLMMLAALLAMVLVAAAPALAQDAVIEGDSEESSNEVSATAGDNSQVALNDCE